MAEHVARAGKSSAKHLSQEISEALRERRWTEASTLLADLSKSAASNVKLGSLQRWTRDADACVDDDKAQWRALLWLLCRVAAGEAADAPTGDVPLRRSVFAALPRAEAADPRAQARIVKARPRGVVSDRTGCDASGVDDDGGGGGDAARGPHGEPRVIPQGSRKVAR